MGELRGQLLRLQLQGLHDHVQVVETLTPLERLHLARATCLLLEAERLEQGEPSEITVVRSVTALEDALQLLVEDNEEAEET